MPQDQRAHFERLTDLSHKAARAWALKDPVRRLWTYAQRGSTKQMWKRWIARTLRTRLETVPKAARTLRDLLWGTSTS